MPSTGHGVGLLVDLDVQAAVGHRLAAPATPRCRPWSATARPPPGRRTRSVTLGDGADGGEFLLMAGHEQHALLIAGVDRQRDRHAREDDHVVERDK